MIVEQIEFDFAKPNRGQRFRKGRSGFVLDLERGVFDPRGYEVVHAGRAHAEARAFIEEHHYAASWPTALDVFELRHHERLVGSLVVAEPNGPKVLPKWFPFPKEAAELSRLLLLDEVPFNAESWFIARVFELLWRIGYAGLVSFSDPMPRERSDGTVVMPGHLGTTYMAASALYLGRTGREPQWLFPDGTVFPKRSRSKIHAYARGATARLCQGWSGAVDRLIARGAPPFTFAHGDPAAARWCDDALTALAVKRRHPGQHRYLFAKRGGPRKTLLKHLEDNRLPILPYPRISLARS